MRVFQLTVQMLLFIASSPQVLWIGNSVVQKGYSVVPLCNGKFDKSIC